MPLMPWQWIIVAFFFFAHVGQRLYRNDCCLKKNWLTFVVSLSPWGPSTDFHSGCQVLHNLSCLPHTSFFLQYTSRQACQCLHVSVCVQNEPPLLVAANCFANVLYVFCSQHLLWNHTQRHVCMCVCLCVCRAVFSFADRCTNYLSIFLFLGLPLLLSHSAASCPIPSIHTC